MTTSHTSADVVFHLGVAAPWFRQHAHRHFVAEYTDRAGRPMVVVNRSDSGFHFHYADDTEAWIDRDAQNVWCTWPATTTLDDVATYLTGPIFGFVLRLRGALAVHASAVQIAGGALVLVGRHGAGKSTTAAALARRGFAVVADDVLHLRPSGAGWLAEPYEGTMRLWASGARLALGSSIQLPRLTPTWEKLALPMNTWGITSARTAVPVSAIAFLEPREGSRAPRLDPITRGEALFRLAVHSSSAHLLDESARAQEFGALDKFVRAIPCARATAAEDSAHFDAFVDLLYEWTQLQSGH